MVLAWPSNLFLAGLREPFYLQALGGVRRAYVTPDHTPTANHVVAGSGRGNDCCRHAAPFGLAGELRPARAPLPAPARRDRRVGPASKACPLGLRVLVHVVIISTYVFVRER